MGARSLASGGRASSIDVKSLGMACNQTSTGPTSLAPSPSAASGGLGRRREPRPPDAEIAQALLQARPGPRLELVRTAHRSWPGSRRRTRTTRRPPRSGAARALECHGQPTRSPSSRSGHSEPRTHVGSEGRARRDAAPAAPPGRTACAPPRRRSSSPRTRRRPSSPAGDRDDARAAPVRARGNRSRRRRRRPLRAGARRRPARPWASAIRSTSRTWFSVSTGMSTPGTNTAAPIRPFLRATRRISSSTTASRSTGSRAASPDAAVAERRGRPPRRSRRPGSRGPGSSAHEVGVEHVRQALALGHGRRSAPCAPRPRAGRRRPASPIQTSADRALGRPVLADRERRRRRRAAPSRAAGTSSRAPATTSGRWSAASRRVSRESARAPRKTRFGPISGT